jgi:hypothetical protein
MADRMPFSFIFGVDFFVTPDIFIDLGVAGLGKGPARWCDGRRIMK